MNERTEIWLRFIGYKIIELLGIGILSIGSYYLGWLMNSWLRIRYWCNVWLFDL